jgi:asparagine synthase (glutamine-hydrolysing)
VCGIVARVDGGDVAPALDVLRERGPHGTASYRKGSLVLGLARLAIVAPRSEARVHTSTNGAIGEVAAVMNGELYEHRSLRDAKGADEESDQALVPVLFERGGVAAIASAVGPVTCAVAAGDTVTLVRDRFGKRPLFVDGERAAASEMKALLAMRGRTASLRFRGDAVARFLSRGILEDDTPLVDGIESVPPGGARVLGRADARNDNEGEAARSPGTSPGAPLELHDAPLELHDALRAACARRVAGLDVPCAVLLSGGLDSSVIAALCRAHVGVAYTMRIRSSDTSDESDKARAMADALGLELRVVDVAPPTFADLAACAWRLETPDAFVGFGVAHAYATLARRLRDDGVRVVVTGEGADELFMGYAWQRAQAAAQNAWPFPRDLEMHERAWAAASMASTRDTRALEVFLRTRFGDPMGARDAMALVNARDIASGAERARPRPSTMGAERRRHDSLCVDLQMWPLRIADRMLMGHGVEPRAPFLDDDVVAAALATPAAAHEHPDVDKPALRALAREVLPAGVDVVRKQGFAAWSWPGAEDTRAWAQRLARDGTLLARADVLDALARSTRDDDALLAWRLIVLEVTARQLDAARGGSPWIP